LKKLLKEKMHTIRIKRKISSPHLRIDELKEFIGKHVEIIVKESSPVKKDSSKKPASGLLSAFRDKGKIKSEKQAWQIAVNEKHGNN
jgi:hypothetical protein